MKKKIAIIVAAIFLFFVIICIGGVVYYNNELKAVDTSNTEEILYEIKTGTGTKSLVEDLASQGIIGNKVVGFIYLKLHSNIAPQAGIYSINKAMSFSEIMNKFTKGDVVDDSISVTFVEGKIITDYVKVINTNFGYSEEEILAKLADKDYLNTLIEKYWFLTDEVLNDKLYYALEGYLYPDTYAFRKDASIEDIITKLLDGMNNKLSDYKSAIENSKYSFHEILTMASIVELEGANSDDRYGVAGVFYNRLNSGMSLGSDVTTYYGAKINMADRDLWQAEIEEVNGYNTRPAAMAGKLPVGPICSPSIIAIDAALNPESHDYYYFVADKNKKTYFSRTYEEHLSTVSKLKQEGLWYEYK